MPVRVRHWPLQRMRSKPALRAGARGDQPAGVGTAAAGLPGQPGQAVIRSDKAHESRIRLGQPQSRGNFKKHGVAFDEALTVFADPLARIFDDPDHSADEPREIIIGYSMKPRLLVVGFTERSGRVRLIHARRATKAERKRHEENITQAR